MEEKVLKLLKKPNVKDCLVGDFRSWGIVNFCLGTGCRTETFLNVHVEDINFDNESVLFRHMKTKKQVIIPLSNTLKIILVEYISEMGLKKEDYLFSLLDGGKCHMIHAIKIYLIILSIGK